MLEGCQLYINELEKTWLELERIDKSQVNNFHINHINTWSDITNVKIYCEMWCNVPIPNTNKQAITSCWHSLFCEFRPVLLHGWNASFSGRPFRTGKRRGFGEGCQDENQSPCLVQCLLRFLKACFGKSWPNYCRATQIKVDRLWVSKTKRECMMFQQNWSHKPMVTKILRKKLPVEDVGGENLNTSNGIKSVDTYHTNLSKK